MVTVTMQRVRLPGNRQTVVEDAGILQAHADQVLAGMRASAICGSDIHCLSQPTQGHPFTPGQERASALPSRVTESFRTMRSTSCRAFRTPFRGSKSPPTRKSFFIGSLNGISPAWRH